MSSLFMCCIVALSLLLQCTIAGVVCFIVLPGVVSIIQRWIIMHT